MNGNKASAVDKGYFGCRFPLFRFDSGTSETRM